MQWLAAPSGKRMCSPTFSDEAIQFCLTIECLFGQPLRQTLGLVQSPLRMASLDWVILDYSTVCRRQKSLKVQVRYKTGFKGVHMLADSTGIKFLGEGEWKTKKHGAECRWHLGINAQTPQIWAIAVTSNKVVPWREQILSQEHVVMLYQ